MAMGTCANRNPPDLRQGFWDTKKLRQKAFETNKNETVRLRQLFLRLGTNETTVRPKNVWKIQNSKFKFKNRMAENQLRFTSAVGTRGRKATLNGFMFTRHRVPWCPTERRAVCSKSASSCRDGRTPAIEEAKIPNQWWPPASTNYIVLRSHRGRRRWRESLGKWYT